MEHNINWVSLDLALVEVTFWTDNELVIRQ
jgi:hypothetical protein